MKKSLSKITLAFAIVGYLAAIGLYYAPVNWHLSPKVVFTICPPALLTITVDPSFITAAMVLAPINALLYGGIGFLISMGIEDLRNGKPS